jgi:hypothetical protein
MTGTCQKCDYWKEFGGPSTGECHCRAPSPYIQETEEKTTHKRARWPLTGQHQVCGEFKPKEKALSDSVDAIDRAQVL